jgi:hypothetical protein
MKRIDINLEELNPGVWFWTDGNDNEEGICLRFLPLEKLREIAKQTTKTTYNYVLNEFTHRMEAVPVYDRDNGANDDLVYDYTIVDWKLKDRSGREIPCTKENKLLLMHEHTLFHRFYLQCVDKLTKMHNDEKEDQKKTSGK